MVRRNNKSVVRNVAIIPRKKQEKKKKKEKEMTILGGLLRGLGGLGGGALGGMAGYGPMGATLGTAAGAQLSKWLGSGDYTLSRNSLVLKGSNTIPSMHNDGQSIIVRHKEYVCDVFSGTGTPSVFNVFDEYALNPGLRASFPWLSTVAQNYVEYTWHGVVFHYVPTSGASVASTNTALGSVMMATNYRATAPSYTNKQVLLNEYFASDGRPSEPMMHPIECDPRENPYNVQYVRTGPVPSNEDQKTYDLGVTTVATQGLPAPGINCGELWVSYEVELRKPKALGSYQYDSLTWGETRTTVTTVANFGTVAGVGAGVATNSQVVATGTSLTFEKTLVGRFYVSCTHSSPTFTTVGAWTPNVTGGTLISNALGPGGTTITSSSGYYTNWGIFESTSPSTSMVISTGTSSFVGTTPYAIMRVYQINSNSI